MFPASDILDLLESRASNGRAAFELADDLNAKLVAVLRQRFGIGRLEAELLIVDPMREHERRLYAALHDQIHLDNAIDAVVAVLPEGAS